jgi:hypothetical protein
VYSQQFCEGLSCERETLESDGKIGYRCPGKPVAAYVTKGDNEKYTVGRMCLCNPLSANAGNPQHLRDGTVEQCLVTMSDDLGKVGRFCTAEDPTIPPLMS